MCLPDGVLAGGDLLLHARIFLFLLQLGNRFFLGLFYSAYVVVTGLPFCCILERCKGILGGLIFVIGCFSSFQFFEHL